MTSAPVTPPGVDPDSVDPDSVERGRELVALAFELVRRLRRHYEMRVAEAGLTPNEARALLGLPVGEPRPISVLAAALGVDPPNATRLVARLGARGLVHRPADPTDGRVKAVALTPPGHRLRRDLEERITAGNPVLVGLSAQQQEALRDLLRQVVPVDPAPPIADDPA